MHAHTGPRFLFSGQPVVNGSAAPPPRRVCGPAPPGAGARRQWTIVRAAPALLPLVALLAIALAFRPDRPPAVAMPGGTPTTIPALADAPTFHGNNARTGEMPGPGPLESAGVVWRSDELGPGDRIWSSPVLAGGLVYVATTSLVPDRTPVGALHALDATGAVRWRFEPGGAMPGTAAVADGRVYIAAGGDTTEGTLSALDATTGREAWRAPAGYGRKWGAPAVVGDVVLLADGVGVRAFDAATGTQRWRFNPQSDAFPRPGSAALAVRDGVVYAPIPNVAGTSSIVVALDVATGEERWRVRLKGFLEPIVVADGSIYVGAGSPDERSGGVYALDAATGEQRWHVTTASPVRATPVVANGVVYVAEMGGTVQALEAATGEVKWARAVASRDLVASPALTGGVLYLARGAIYSDAAPTGQGTIYALDAASGSPRWELPISPAGIVSSPLVANGVLYVGCDDGRVYALGRLEGMAAAATAASR